MRILLVTPHFYPDMGPSTPIYTALAEDLGRKNHQLQVVTAFPHYGCDLLPSQFRGKWFEETEHRGIKVTRGFVRVTKKSSVIGRLVSYLSLNLSAGITLFRMPKPDVVITHSPVLMIGLPVLLLRVLKGVPFIYHIQDIYPDVAVQSGVLRTGIFVRVIGYLESVTCKLSAAVPVISEGFRDALLVKGVDRKKIELIPNCVDTEFLRPMPRMTEFRRKLGLEKKFIVLYAGNVGFGQGLDVVIKAASSLANDSSIHFVIVGQGATKDTLKSMVNDLALTNVTFVDFQPPQAVPEVLATGDIHLVPLRKGIALHSVPSKVWSIMSSGRPIIASVDSNTDTSRIVIESGSGIVVAPEDHVELSQAILSMISLPRLMEKMGESGRNYVVSKLGRDIAADRFHNLLGLLVS